MDGIENGKIWYAQQGEKRLVIANKETGEIIAAGKPSCPRCYGRGQVGRRLYRVNGRWTGDQPIPCPCLKKQMGKIQRYQAQFGHAGPLRCA